MYPVLLSSLTAFGITFFSLPSIIYLAKVKKLYPALRDRDVLREQIPRLGGFAIFAGLLFSIIFFSPFRSLGDLQYIICSLIIIFLIGGRDDLLPLSASKKFAGELLAALILVFKAEVRLTSFHGVFGITAIPEWASISLSLFTVILLINAINLIDGINGLSGLTGIIICSAFGAWFGYTEHYELAVIAFSLVGALAGFLIFNFQSKIIMGDTGALIVGTICAVLSIKFIEYNAINPEGYIQSYPAIAIGVMIIPLFDTLRVFVLRVMKGRSPFSPDRNHIHHLLLDTGKTHAQATTILALVNIAIIAISYALQSIGSLLILSIQITLALSLTGILHYYARVLPKRRALAHAERLSEAERTNPSSDSTSRMIGKNNPVEGVAH